MPRHRRSGSSGDDDAGDMRRGIAVQKRLQVSVRGARLLGGSLLAIMIISSRGRSDMPRDLPFSEGMEKDLCSDY